MPPRTQRRPQQGRGTHTFRDGMYTGEWRGGKRHGQGAMAYTDGGRCVRHASLRWARKLGLVVSGSGRRQAAGGGRQAAGGGRRAACAGVRAATDAGAGGGLLVWMMVALGHVLLAGTRANGATTRSTGRGRSPWPTETGAWGTRAACRVVRRGPGAHAQRAAARREG